MNTKAELIAYLESLAVEQKILDYFNGMSEERVALFLTVRCGNTEAGVDQELTRFK